MITHTMELKMGEAIQRTMLRYLILNEDCAPSQYAEIPEGVIQGSELGILTLIDTVEGLVHAEGDTWYPIPKGVSTLSA